MFLGEIPESLTNDLLQKTTIGLVFFPPLLTFAHICQRAFDISVKAASQQGGFRRGTAENFKRADVKTRVPSEEPDSPKPGR